MDDNPLLTAIEQGDYEKVSKMINQAPLLLKLQNTNPVSFQTNTSLLGDSTSSMNALQYALTLDDVDTHEIVALLINVSQFT